MASSVVIGQLTKLEEPNMRAQAEIYIDQNGVRYSTLINVNFKEPVIEAGRGRRLLNVNNFSSTPSLVAKLSVIEKKYG